jgi:hypothetical protein
MWQLAWLQVCTRKDQLTKTGISRKMQAWKTKKNGKWKLKGAGGEITNVINYFGVILNSKGKCGEEMGEISKWQYAYYV